MKYDLSNKMDLNSYKERANYLAKKGSKVELKEIKKIRSIKQNSYLHVCISLYAIEFGYTIDEVKTDLKRGCSFMSYEKKGRKYLKKTSQMNTEELTKFIEWIRNFAASEGLYIPGSEEYLEHKFNIDRLIDQHKEFL